MTTTLTMKTQTIQERITGLIDTFSQNRKEVRELKEKLEAAESNMNESSRNVVFMQRMAQIARYDQNVTVWHERFNDKFPESHENEWIHHFEIKVATFEFQITISRKRHLKKFKHHVEVRGSQFLISENLNALEDAYKKGNYLSNKYKDEELEKKFVHINDAFAFVEQWKKLLEADHAEILAEQRAIYEQLKGANLIYDYDTARKNSYNRTYSEALSTLHEIGIINKTDLLNESEGH